MGGKISSEVRSESSDEIRYLLKSGAWTNAGTLVGFGVSLGVSIAFANFVPAETFGTYQYLLSLLAIGSAFTLTGVNSAITRSVARGFPGTLSYSIRPQLRWNAFVGLGMLTVSLGYLASGQVELSIGIAVIAVALPLLTTFNSYGAFLLGVRAFRTQFAYTTLASGTYAIAILAAIAWYPTATSLIAANVGVGVAIAVFLHLRTLRRPDARGAADPDAMRYGNHLSLMNGIGAIANQIDSLLVFHLLGPAQLALYAFATQIPDRLSGLLKNVTNTALPRFATRPLRDIRRSLLLTAGLFAAVIGAGITLYIFIVPWVFEALYPAYLNAIPYSQLYAFTLIAAVGNLIGTALLAHRYVRRLYVLNTVFPIVQAVLQVIGIFGWGLVGLITARLLTVLGFVALTVPLALYDKMPNSRS